MKGKYGYYTGEKLNSFFMVPDILFKSEEFADISYGAKLLYAFLLDRMSLSEKNGWRDDNGHIYIYYTLDAVCEFLKISKGTCVKLFHELDSEHGCGLIIRKNQGLCKPMKIYVMNCEGCGKSVENSCPQGVENFPEFKN